MVGAAARVLLHGCAHIGAAAHGRRLLHLRLQLLFVLLLLGGLDAQIVEYESLEILIALLDVVGDDDRVEEARMLAIVLGIPLGSAERHLALLLAAAELREALAVPLLVQRDHEHTARLEVGLLEREQRLELHLNDAGEALARDRLHARPLGAVPVAHVLVAADELALRHVLFELFHLHEVVVVAGLFVAARLSRCVRHTVQINQLIC